MRENPVFNETYSMGKVKGIGGVFVVDGAACLRPNFLPKSDTFKIMANADRIVDFF